MLNSEIAQQGKENYANWQARPQAKIDFLSSQTMTGQFTDRSPATTTLKRDTPIQVPYTFFAETVDTGQSATHVQDEIEALRRSCDRVGIKRPEAGTLQNYDFVLARWNFNRCKTDKEREEFGKNELKNIETALRERNNTEISRQPLYFNPEGKIYNPAFAKESWEEVVQRGIDFRKSEGSLDGKREQAELTGFLKVQDQLREGPVGSAAIVISQPSEVEMSPYVKNFVDVYLKVKDPNTGETQIEYTRYASAISKEKYRDIAKEMQPDYFTEYNASATSEDAHFLENPLFVETNGAEGASQTLFANYFEKDNESMQEEAWQELWQQRYYPFALHLKEAIMQETFDPLEIAMRLNTLIHSGENEEMIEEMKKDMGETFVFVSPKGTALDDKLRFKMRGFVDKFGTKQVKKVSVGCGDSGGVTIDATANSVAQFGFKSNESKGSKCDSCTRDTSDNHYHCPDCNESYKDETSKAATDRTKECRSCPFKFAC